MEFLVWWVRAFIPSSSLDQPQPDPMRARVAIPFRRDSCITAVAQATTRRRRPDRAAPGPLSAEHLPLAMIFRKHFVGRPLPVGDRRHATRSRRSA
jgi:hypothetical protein